MFSTADVCWWITDLLCSFKSLRFLLTDSRVPRNTKQLVAGVAAMKEQEPEFVNGLLSAIQYISDEAQRALADPQLSRQTLLSALSVRSPFLSVSGILRKYTLSGSHR